MISSTKPKRMAPSAILKASVASRGRIVRTQVSRDHTFAGGAGPRSRKLSLNLRSRHLANHIDNYLSLKIVNKQLLDILFVISGVIKVEVSVISPAEGRG